MLRGALFILLLLTLVGCGTVGPVQPLQKALPQAVNNATVQQKGLALLLAWDIPTSNQDDSALTDLAGFAVYKTDYDLAKGCPECRPPKTLLRKIDLDYYRSSNRNSQRIYLWDSAVEEETGYSYKIVPYTDAGHEGGATLLHRACFTTASAVTELSAQGLDNQVRLTWIAAEENRQGIELLGYNIYRRSGKEYFATQPNNEQPITATGYDDLNVENGKDYTYAVRTVIAIGDLQLESTLSAEAIARPNRP